MTSTVPLSDNIYFAPLLPWQNELWSQLTQRVLAPQQSLPHALLVAACLASAWSALTGIPIIGKTCKLGCVPDLSH